MPRQAPQSRECIRLVGSLPVVESNTHTHTHTLFPRTNPLLFDCLCLLPTMILTERLFPYTRPLCLLPLGAQTCFMVARSPPQSRLFTASATSLLAYYFRTCYVHIGGRGVGLLNDFDDNVDPSILSFVALTR